MVQWLGLLALTAKGPGSILVGELGDASWWKRIIDYYYMILEKGMATHSSFLAWKIPRREKPGRLQFTMLQRIGHN